MSPASAWAALLRPGDFLLLAGATALVALSAHWAWRGGGGERAVIRVDGRVFSEIDLAARKTLDVPGALGTTVVRVEAGRARVVSDPGPRQYCVLQGWLARAGEIAICAPSHVSLQIVGRGPALDSLAY